MRRAPNPCTLELGREQVEEKKNEIKTRKTKRKSEIDVAIF